MKYLEIANSGLLYLLAGLVIVFVVVQSVVFLRLAWARGIEIGLSKEKMWEAVKTSAVFAIVPSIPIVISLIAIAPILGMPFSWMRLSVIGSQSYELIAAGTGARFMLLSKDQRNFSKIIQKKVKYYELATHPKFQDEYINSTLFPHKDLNRFPQSSKLLKMHF